MRQISLGSYTYLIAWPLTNDHIGLSHSVDASPAPLYRSTNLRDCINPELFNVPWFEHDYPVSCLYANPRSNYADLNIGSIAHASKTLNRFLDLEPFLNLQA